MKNIKNSIGPIVMIMAGFGSTFLKPIVRERNILGKGKHPVRVVSAEYVKPEDNDQYVREEGEIENQLKVVMRNAKGAITAWLNAIGWTRSTELTAADIPADLNYKALNTSEAAFKKLSEAKKLALVFDTTSEGHAVRRDTRQRIPSEQHTQEALEIAGSCLGACGLAEGDFTADTLPAVLVGKTLKIQVESKTYEGVARSKVNGFMPLPEAELELIDQAEEA